MQKRILMSGVVAVAMSAAVIVACGDDDEPATPGPSNNGDSGGVDATPGNEASSSNDAAVDSSVQPDAQTSATPVLPENTVRVPNAINPYGLVYASDNYLYMSGATVDEGARKLAVWRFNLAGELDTTFNGKGWISVAVPGTEASFDIAEVSVGNFIVHAVTSGDFGRVYLVKLTNSGGVFSFGEPKSVVFDWDDQDAGTWPDGGAKTPVYNTSWGIGVDRRDTAEPKIVVFASGAPLKPTSGDQRVDNDRWVARVKYSDLTADPTFNNGKAFSTDIGDLHTSDNARRGIVLADGTIISAGYTSISGVGHIVLLRLKPDGTLDTSFGANALPGQLKLNPFAPNGSAEAYAVTRQSSGRIVTTGYGNSHFDTPTIAVDMMTSGWKDDGLDPTFGRQGSFAIQSETDPAAGIGSGVNPNTINRDRGRDVVALPDDRLVYAGAYDEHGAIFVFDKNGKPDPSSGVNGRIVYGYPAGFFKIAMSADGKHLAATAESLNQTVDASAPVGSVLVTLKVGQ
jgi:uncharacterized delta-60 repeat protein